ncbi:MAG: PAS domain-containing protein, partial [Anaerolinea sp.]|nr:PAS domain-containing protein [Anaerolinea sp.]
HPDDLERVAQEVGDYSASGVAQFTQEYRVITKDGQVRWTDDRTHIIRSETGEITHYQGIVIDITERKLAEAAMHESEIRLKSLVNNVPGTIYRCALDADYTMEVISDDIIHLSGYPAADFIGNRVRSYASIIYEEDRELVDTVILEGVQNQTSYTIEYRLRHADGRLIWIGERGQAIYDENGAARWLDGVLLDITGQKEAEAALAKRAREMQAVFEVSNAIATILDPTSLLQEVADRTKANFNLYHTHIYLLDETGSILKLAAGAGDVGREMVAQDWQIPISRTDSVVARVARNKVGAIVNDVRNEPGFLFNEMLPNTRAELAVPLLISEQLLGVLDVQADTPDHFTADDVIIQTSLAAQVSIAIQNARSFVTSEAARQELSLLTRRLTHEGWQSYLTQETTPQINVTYGQDLGNDTPLQQALTIQGESIGHMTIGRPQALEADATEILTAVAERLSSHVENLRLTAQTEVALAQTEQQAERLSLLNEMGAALSKANTLADIYQAAARYTGQILDGDSTSLALLNPAGGSLTLIALEGIEAGNIIGENLPLAGTAIARALHEQRSLIAPQDFPLGDSALAAEGIQSFICAPLLTSDRPLGALNVGSKKANAYDRTDTYLVQQVVSLLATTLESRRLFEETRRRAERETLLNVISQKIQSAPTIESALQTAVTELGQALKLKQIQVRLNIDKKANRHTEHAATEERYHG